MAGNIGLCIALIAATSSTSSSAFELRQSNCARLSSQHFPTAPSEVVDILCLKTIQLNDLRAKLGTVKPCPACPPPRVERKNDVFDLATMGVIAAVVAGALGIGFGVAISR